MIVITAVQLTGNLAAVLDSNDKNHGPAGPWNSTFEPVAWKFQFFLEMSRVGGDDDWSVLWIYAVY